MNASETKAPSSLQEAEIREDGSGSRRSGSGFILCQSGTLLEKDPLGLGVPMPVIPGAVSVAAEVESLEDVAIGSIGSIGSIGGGLLKDLKPHLKQPTLPNALLGVEAASAVPAEAASGAPSNVSVRDIPLERTTAVPGSYAVNGPGTPADDHSSLDDDTDNAVLSTSGFLVPEAFMVPEQGDEENNIIHAEATPMKDTSSTHCSRAARVAFAILLIIVIGLVLGMVGVFLAKSSTKSPAEPVLVDASPTDDAPILLQDPSFDKPTLQRVLERGVLRCGSGSQLKSLLESVIKQGNDTRFSADKEPTVVDSYCRVLSAAIFHGTASYELVFDEPNVVNAMLANHSLDVVISRQYINMVADVYEADTRQGLAYCQPYLTGGTGFCGVPHFVNCSDNYMKTRDECSDFKLCINTKFQIAEEILQNIPRSMIVPCDNSTEVIQKFFQGQCNVIASESAATLKAMLEAKGYPGEVSVGSKVYDIFRFALYTLDSEPEWFDMVNAITMALLIAERDGITRETAHQMPSAAEWFGDDFKNLLVDAVGELGNFADLYKMPIPRTSIPNNGSLGLLSPSNFGAVESSAGRPPIPGGTLATVLDRGFLKCGVHGNRPGFALYNTTTSAWEGLDIDYCFALAASLFGGNAMAVRYHDLSADSSGFVALQSGAIDVLAGELWTLDKDMKEPVTQVGYTFSTPYFYGPVDDTRFEENLCLATRQDDAQWSDFVNWISLSIVYAEKHGITSIDSNQMPIVTLYGERLQRMFRDVIYAVGNYGDLYDRNVAPIVPRGGRNQLEKDIPTYYYPPWN